MDSSNFKTAIRYFNKYRSFTFINLSGLTIGFVCCLFIFLYITDEFKFDKHHEKGDRIYRVCRDYKMANAEGISCSTTPPMANALKDEFPEIEEVVRFSSWDFEVGVQYNDNKFVEKNIIAADKSIFKVFTIPLISGNEDEALKNPLSVVLSESTAKKYFGKQDPLGKIITIRGDKVEVTGIAKDCPFHSHFKYDFILSLSTLAQLDENGWFQHAVVTYVLLKENQKPGAVEAKLSDFVVKYLGPFFRREGKTIQDEFSQGFRYDLFLQPLADIHLNSEIDEHSNVQGSKQAIIILALIGLIILILASINFTNLSIALTTKRNKELAIRKILGSDRKELVIQVFTEIFTIALISLVIAILITQILLPWFNLSFNKQIDPDFLTSPLSLTYFAALLAGVAFLTTFMLAMYYWRNMISLNTLKNKVLPAEKQKNKNILIVVQFAACIAIIMATIIVFKQGQYIQNKKLGYNTENILMVRPANIWGNARKALKLELLEEPDIVNVVNVGESFGNIFNNAGHSLENGHGGYIYTLSADYDFIDAFNIKIKDGRYFSRKRKTDEKAVLLNETAVKMLNLDDPVGERFRREEFYTVIGVVNDFHFNSLYHSINPLIIYLNDEYWGESMYIEYKTSNFQKTITKIEDIWNKHAPGEPFAFSFLDTALQNHYASVAKTQKLLTLFSILAIVIAALGLFGLTAFAFEQRTKEIGIRKVNGAKVSEILTMLNKDFVKWVMIAFVIATPVGWFAMHKWLENFAYKTELNWWIFALAGLLALGIALLTVSWQSWRAATRNPVEALRYE
jgi:putative ABC transport system permease protein